MTKGEGGASISCDGSNDNFTDVDSTTTSNESAALPFVIPSAAEGSAVPRTIPGNVSYST
jgi:hypothetical protein